MKDLVILKTGTALDSLRARRGDFEHYFATALGIPIEACRIVDPRRGDAFPAHDECRAVVITGSPEMITDNPEWSRASERWVREGIDHGTPFLGICYGHQLLAQALGAPVGWTKKGVEIGTVTVDLERDAWANGFWRQPPEQLTVQMAHNQSVHDVPPNGRLLASNSHDLVQGFAWEQHVWGFQFHPEFDADILRTYLHAESEELRSAGRDPQQILDRTQDSDDGRTLLREFARFVGM